MPNQPSGPIIPRCALTRFTGSDRTSFARKQTRSPPMLTAMRGLSSDIRFALRSLRHGGLATIIAVLSLAVGVGANAAIFSVGYAMLVRPLPYVDADRLVMLRP